MIARRLRERLCWDPTLDPLEARALIAMAEGRHTDADRLFNVIARRNCVGLTVIRATKKSRSTSIEPSSPLSTFKSQERSSG